MEEEIKVSEMTQAQQLTDSDIVMIVQQNINKKITIAMLKQTILDVGHPIGSTYITQTNTNPSTILGFGTWERLKGKVVVGLDEDDPNFNEIGKEVGEKTHTLTIQEIPAHNHDRAVTKAVGTNAETIAMGNSTSQSDIADNGAIRNTGGGQAHNNIQPTKVVGYMWIRTA